jgi:hypothetical protein
MNYKNEKTNLIDMLDNDCTEFLESDSDIDNDLNSNLIYNICICK